MEGAQDLSYRWRAHVKPMTMRTIEKRKASSLGHALTNHSPSRVHFIKCAHKKDTCLTRQKRYTRESISPTGSSRPLSHRNASPRLIYYIVVLTRYGCGCPLSGKRLEKALVAPMPAWRNRHSRTQFRSRKQPPPSARQTMTSAPWRKIQSQAA